MYALLPPSKEITLCLKNCRDCNPTLIAYYMCLPALGQVFASQYKRLCPMHFQVSVLQTPQHECIDAFLQRASLLRGEAIIGGL